jgi:hypothetical protein
MYLILLLQQDFWTGYTFGSREGTHVLHGERSLSNLIICYRHRFLATYVSGLIIACYVAPHRVLNHYVLHMTGFTPSDAEDKVRKEPSVKSPFINFKPFNFDSLESGVF